jgi:hypothetical protein
MLFEITYENKTGEVVSEFLDSDRTPTHEEAQCYLDEEYGSGCDLVDLKQVNAIDGHYFWSKVLKE